MDVAQALQQHEQHIRESSLTPEPDLFEEPDADTRGHISEDGGVDETPRMDVKGAIAGWGRNIGSAERRRSTYERFPVITLPPLAEEKTPAATPLGSLSRGFTQAEQPPSNVQDIHRHLQGWTATEPMEKAVSATVLTAEPEPEPEEPFVHLGGCALRALSPSD